ncbi:hypothetical protein [Streptomyces sp. WZ.A104]|uniref:hypothetical protein n=1 Tax=Streptomyces sp. WZ.A104 TaxID=2023771 RepID=UPI0015CA4EF8|nr:hypothetical protein [Streptomyces sp. WZ.A104]
MTPPHSASPVGEALDTSPGPNQWIKDHLDGLIDEHLLPDSPSSVTATPSPTEEKLLP